MLKVIRVNESMRVMNGGLYNHYYDDQITSDNQYLNNYKEINFERHWISVKINSWICPFKRENKLIFDFQYHGKSIHLNSKTLVKSVLHEMNPENIMILKNEDSNGDPLELLKKEYDLDLQEKCNNLSIDM